MAVTPAPGIHLAARGTFVPRLTRGWASPRDLAPGEAEPWKREAQAGRSVHPSRLVLGPGMPPTPGPEDETPGTCFGMG